MTLRLPLAKQWFSAAELAAIGLPDLPRSVKGVNRWAQASGLVSHPEHSRPRQGKGGGREYHLSALPLAAQRKLMAAVDGTTADEAARAALWRAYDALPENGRAEAARRLAIVQEIAQLERAGMKRSLAVREIAEVNARGERTVYDWLRMLKGVDPVDWLAALAPRRRGPTPDEVNPADAESFMGLFKSLFLASSRPTFADCHRHATKVAKAKGWSLIPYRTAVRQYHAQVPQAVEVYARFGASGMQRLFPSQIRDRTGLVAMEAVNADVHKFDVFVRLPDGTVGRPQMSAFQDLYSGKLLSWRLDHSANSVMVMEAFGEMVEAYGIPRRCVFDNGMEFASKKLTGGAATRFRFKVKEDEPLGILVAMGIEMHWATPGHGQAKPIERFFRDVANSVAKDPRFHGAWVGNKPDAKPEDYGSRAVPMEEFLAVVTEGIAELNARTGRESPTCHGRSFDETFAASYACAPIMKATEEQRMLWLMGSKQVKVPKEQVRVRLFNNEYYADWLIEHAGTSLVARFNPSDLQDGIWMFTKDGVRLGFCECRQAVGFFDEAGARNVARQRAQQRKLVKQLENLHRPLGYKDLAHIIRETAPQPGASEELDAKVVALTPPKSRTSMRPARQVPEPSPELDAARETLITTFEARRGVTETTKEDEGPADIFRRARAVLARIEAGESVGEEEAAWATSYAETPQYQSLAMMFDRFGEEGIG